MCKLLCQFISENSHKDKKWNTNREALESTFLEVRSGRNPISSFVPVSESSCIKCNFQYGDKEDSRPLADFCMEINTKKEMENNPATAIIIYREMEVQNKGVRLKN
jgi:hypothetical protein